MKSTGITRKLDSLGRIVLPSELRNLLNINIKDEIEIYTEGDYIILKKYENSCVFCGEMKNLLKYKDKHICKDCKLSLLNKTI